MTEQWERRSESCGEHWSDTVRRRRYVYIPWCFYVYRLFVTFKILNFQYVSDNSFYSETVPFKQALLKFFCFCESFQNHEPQKRLLGIIAIIDSILSRNIFDFFFWIIRHLFIWIRRKIWLDRYFNQNDSSEANIFETVSWFLHISACLSFSSFQPRRLIPL